MALVLLTSLVFMDLAIPRLVQRIIDQGILQRNQGVVLQTSLIMIGISILSTAIAVGNNILSVQVGESVARDIRDALFKKIQAFSYGDLDQHQTGQLIVRLTSDTTAVQRLTQVSLRIGTRAPLLMIGSLILMINTSPSLALTMLPLLLITSAIIVIFAIKMEPLFRSVQQKLDRLNNVLLEYDTFYRPKYQPEQNLWPLIHKMTDAGFGSSIALATDMVEEEMYANLGGGPGLASLPNEIQTRFKREGLSETVNSQLLKKNILRRLARLS